MSLFYDTFASWIHVTCARAVRFVSTHVRHPVCPDARHSLTRLRRHPTRRPTHLTLISPTIQLLTAEVKTFPTIGSLAPQKSLNIWQYIVTASRTRALTTCGGSRGSGTNPVIYPECHPSTALFHRSYTFGQKSQRSGIIIIFLLRSSIAIILFKSISICSSLFSFHSPVGVSIRDPNNGHVKKDV